MSAKKFYNISAEEMRRFMQERKFRLMNMPGCLEQVYGKIVNVGDHRLSLRVYTGIDVRDKTSRACGSDAIRVQLWFMHEGEPAMVGRQQNVRRIKTWAKNLDKAIAAHSESENFRICEACGNPLVERERKSDGNKFWGCVTYFKTKCPGYVKKADQPKTDASPKVGMAKSKVKGIRIADDMMTENQREVERLFLETDQHMMLGALAGSGKTAMCLHLASHREMTQYWQYIVFNRKNAAEGRSKFPKGIPVQTQHSFDARWLRKCLVDMPKESTGNKTFRIMENVYPHMSNKKRKRIRRAAFRLVGLAKAFACKPGDLDEIKAVMDKYDFELESEGEFTTAVEVTSGVLEASLPQNCGNEYNYDDLLWWPVVLDLEVPKLNIVLADECQDFNKCQHDRLKRLADAGARIIAVGDRFQAVYRFRGADNDSFDNLKALLADTPRGVVETDLPDNFRCGRRHIEFVQANTCVGNKIRAHKGAAEGKVITDMTYERILDMLAADLGGKQIA